MLLHLLAGAAKFGQKNDKCDGDDEALSEDEDDESGPTIFEKDHKSRSSPGTSRQNGGFLHFMRYQLFLCA